MVKSYRETTTDIISLLTSNKTALGIKQVAEAGATIDFNLQAPFVYIHFDLDSKLSSGCQSISLTVEFFVGASDKNISEAKAKAIELAAKIVVLFEDFPLYYEDSPLELFAEYADKAILRLEAKTTIFFGV
jgi:hypothetical protein